MDLTHPRAIAEKGEQIYNENYKASYESDHPGKFVAIDVLSAKAFVADTPEGAMEEARKQSPKGLFHLMKVGSQGAFRVSYTSSDNLERLFK